MAETVPFLADFQWTERSLNIIMDTLCTFGVTPAPGTGTLPLLSPSSYSSSLLRPLRSYVLSSPLSSLSCSSCFCSSSPLSSLSWALRPLSPHPWCDLNADQSEERDCGGLTGPHTAQVMRHGDERADPVRHYLCLAFPLP